jgi:two-component system NarL family response regulator
MINSQSDMIVVGEAGTGRESLNLLATGCPDVVLMDLKLPDMTGIECTSKLRRISTDARIIILTTYDGNENIFRAFQAGAKAYLLKDMSGDEILNAIRTVDAGQTYLPASIGASLAQRISEDELSPREVGILHHIASGSSNKEIGSQLGISESTVKGHVNHLLSKLKVRDRTEAVTVALRRGLISLD